MKLIITTAIELNSKTGILVFPNDTIWDRDSENFNKDFNILITSEGVIYKENSSDKQYIYDKETITSIISNPLFKQRYILNEYGRFGFNELDYYINDSKFMEKVASFLGNNKTFSKLRLAESLGIEKSITNKLVSYLIENRLVVPFHSYFKSVT